VNVEKTLILSALTEPISPPDLTAFTADMGGERVRWKIRTPRSSAKTTAWILLLSFVGVPLLIAAVLILVALATGKAGIAVAWVPAAVLFAAFAGYWAIPMVRHPFLGLDWETVYRLAQFAAENDLDYSPSDVRPSYPGVMFQNIPTIELYNHFQSRSGRYFDFGNFRYNAHLGELSEVGHHGFLALQLDQKLPHLILDAKGNNTFGGSLAVDLPGSTTVKLGRDFDRHFTLLCPPGHEREALYVLTPELMALLIDDSEALDVELIDDWMFVYSKKPFDSTDPGTMRRIFRIIDGLGAAATRSASVYRDEHVGDFHRNLVAPTGQRLTAGLPKGLSVVFSLLLASIPWGLFSSLLFG
jgi:hypothetical protein